MCVSRSIPYSFILIKLSRATSTYNTSYHKEIKLGINIPSVFDRTIISSVRAFSSSLPLLIYGNRRGSPRPVAPCRYLYCCIFRRLGVTASRKMAAPYIHHIKVCAHTRQEVAETQALRVYLIVVTSAMRYRPDPAPFDVGGNAPIEFGNKQTNKKA